MKLKTKIFLLTLAILLSWIVFLLSQSFEYPSPDEIKKRANYLQRVVHEPLDNDSEIIKLGRESHEWMLFSYAFSSYAFTNLAIRDSTFKNQAIENIKTAIAKALDYKIASGYGIEPFLLQTDSIPDYSILYLGHLNLMMGCYRLLSGDDTFNDLNDKISKSLFHRYENTSYLNLESYPSAIWIPDNTVAMASLKLHSLNTGSSYDSLCKKWVDYAKAHYIDPETGVLFSTIDPATGNAVEEPRGSMLGWSIMFIFQFDKDFAIDLYDNYKNHFSNNFWIFRLFRERQNNTQTDIGDIDSGPVFMGFSIPANEFALSNAIIAGDLGTAKQLERLIDFGTRKIEKNGEIKYNVRFVDMNISPMAEALVLNSLTITEWIGE